MSEDGEQLKKKKECWTQIDALKINKDDIIVVKSNNPIKNSSLGSFRAQLKVKYGFEGLVIALQPEDELSMLGEKQMRLFGWKKDKRLLRNKQIRERFWELRRQKIKTDDAIERVIQEIAPRLKADSVKTICYTHK